MIPARKWNPRLGVVSTCVVVPALHLVLRQILAEREVISAIFAAGDHLPKWMISCIAAFAATRLFSMIAVPGLLAWRATTWLLARYCMESGTRDGTET